MKKLLPLFLAAAPLLASAGQHQTISVSDGAILTENLTAWSTGNMTAWNATTYTAPTWYEQFARPLDKSLPWTFWYWMFGNVSDEGIRLDLNAMHDAGIKGFYLMPIKDPTDSKDGLGGNSRQLSTEWWKRMDTAFRTADSLNLEMGIHFCDGFALAGGPWIKPEESMQKVVWSDTIVSGGRYNYNGKRRLSLATPCNIYKDYYKDIAVYAYPATYADDRKPTASVEFPFKSTQPCDIVMQYDKPFTLRSVEIVTGGNNYQAHRFKVYASDNGTDYKFVREIYPARQGWQNTDALATYAIPATTARYFKFHWTPEGSDPGSEDMDAAKWKPNLKIGGMNLGSEPVIDGYEGKSGVVWRVSKDFPIADSECVDPSKIIDLTDKFTQALGNATATADIILPKGKWHIVRIGHTSTGHTNATGGGGRGLECDKFSTAAVDKQFDNWFANIYRHAPQDIVKRVLKRLHVDSWEAGSQNWNATFLDEFKKRRGYDLRPWLLLYAGVPMKSSEQSGNVLHDIRLTIADLINDVFFTEVRRLANQYGMELSTECVAPTMVSDGLRHYQFADYPMGEFWLNSPTHDKLNDMLDAVSGAHIYGKNIIQAEGFTEIRGTWDEHPAMLKKLLDHNYCIGTNSIVFHVNTHNPFTDRKPGMTLDGIGTFFQRDNTWWKEMPTFTGYISRTQALLQYGKPVSDIAVYIGDEMPRRSIMPERLMGSLPGLFFDKTLQEEAARKANVGQPTEMSPVGVTHTKNMTKADDWVNTLNGYRYDSFNHDALKGCRVENGKLITRGGTEYSVFVVPQPRLMNPDNINTASATIDSIAQLGVPVIKNVWKERDLSTLGIKRDATLPEGIDFTHRHAADADIYFLSNQSNESKTFTPLFRDKRPVCYVVDAESNRIMKADIDKEITLPSGNSLFYIFTNNEIDSKYVYTPKNVGTLEPLTIKKWNVSFENTGKSIEMTELKDWTSYSDDNSIRYYSGHATYETTFKYGKPTKGNECVVIDLGQVENIATVYVNDTLCGTAWRFPYQVDITNAVKKGNNKLKIVVVNTWANALQGNDEGKAPFSGIWTNGKFRRASKELLPAGLLGPIRISQH